MSGNYTGTLYIVAAPSGGGKTSLVRNLVNTLDGIQVSVSHTTRTARPGEVDGENYFFVSNSEFMRMVENGEFIEHARVFDQLYGTSNAQISARLEQGIDVVLDIDWQGAEQIRRLYKNVFGIFLIPPSLDVLSERLQNRRQDTDAIIRERMVKAQDELSHYLEFDYLIVSDEFEKAASELKAIVVANRLRTDLRANKYAKLLSFLMAKQ